MWFASETQGAGWIACALLLCLAAVCAQDPAASCPKPCYVVKDYWPFKTCKAECTPDVCNRGWGAWGSQELCCAPGVAFPEGCSKRPDQCWTIENYQLRTCIQDNRKCLQGYGVWASQAACCAPGAAFPQGCGTDIVRATQPCWVVDTYFPARLCRQSDTLCTPAANVQSWPSQTACCSSAFSEGCSVSGPQAPCYVVDSYWPLRLCRKETDIAACSRGWGVYQSEAICCSPAVAFPEGCSPRPASIPPLNSTLNANSTLSVPAASAAIASNAALTAAAGDAALAAIPGQMNMTAPMPAAPLPTVAPSAGP